MARREWEKMKANRKFRDGEEAVSAVIGVILMVAITVAIAATVYYYVTVMMPAGETSTPTFQLTKDDTQDRLEVAQADAEADWDRLYIYAQNGTDDLPADDILFDLNSDASVAGGDTGVGDTAGTKTHVTDAVNAAGAGVQDLMSAGEYIEFCVDGNDYTEITITIIDGVSNQVIGSYTFIDIAAG